MAEKRINNIIRELESMKEQAKDQLRGVLNHSGLDSIRIKFLGKKGHLAEITKLLPKLKPSERILIGKTVNKTKKEIQSAVTSAETRIVKLQREHQGEIDLTLPVYPRLGTLHPVTKAIQEISDIFKRIGFIRVSYPEIDWDWYAFESLHMPPKHPARDEWETFFVDIPAHDKLGRLVLTPHTSNGQVRELERLKKPPVRMINIARCYRRQQDVTHTPMFHQFEGLVVDKGINLTHLKGIISYFVKQFYGERTKSRLRPFHFQFTEPSFEVDFSCVHCDEKGCRFCKSGWHEVGGAGMVHPVVLKNGGFDPKKYTGLAFGWGIERTLSLRPDVQINDIRILYDNDIRFLKQQ